MRVPAMRVPAMRLLLPILLPVVLGGCTDPFLRTGTWHPEGISDANLHAMIVNPRDLDHGVSEPGTDGKVAAAAAARLRHGEVKPLLDTGISKVGSTGAVPAASPPSGAGGT